ncbi:MAG: ABC transporter permease [Actinomycetota bacterium]
MAPSSRLALAATVSIATVALSILIGGIPLAIGLAVASMCAIAVLPGGSRRYLLARVVRVVGTIAVAMALVWLLVHNYPDASRTEPAGVVPAMERYGDWVGGALVGDLGDSQYSETVGTGIGRTIPISLQLVAYSQVLALLLAIPAAIVGARFRGRLPDRALLTVAFGATSLPVFVSGLILIVVFGLGGFPFFGIDLGVAVLPTGRYTPIGDGLVPHIRSVVLPSVTLALSTAATYVVVLRSAMVDQLSEPHADLARAKGVPPMRLVTRHAMRPAAPAAVALVAAQAGGVLGLLVVIERMFLIPGFGDYVLVAVGRRDDLAVVGALFVTAIILAVINLFADALLLAIDPRIES